MLVGIVLGLVGWINQPLERCYFTGLLSIQSRHGRDRSRFFAPKSNHPNVRGNSAKVAPNFIRLAAIGASPLPRESRHGHITTRQSPAQLSGLQAADWGGPLGGAKAQRYSA